MSTERIATKTACPTLLLYLWLSLSEQTAGKQANTPGRPRVRAAAPVTTQTRNRAALPALKCLLRGKQCMMSAVRTKLHHAVCGDRVRAHPAGGEGGGGAVR